MRAAVYDPNASPPSMRLVEVPHRPIEPNEVRIDVRAVPMSDYWLRLERAPFVPGWVVAGVITEHGPEITRHHVGQRVVAMHRMGGLAESVIVPRSAIHAIPDDLAFVEAATLSAGFKASQVVDELCSRIHGAGPSPTVAVLHDGTAFASILTGLMVQCGAAVIGLAGAPNQIENQLELGFVGAANLDTDPIEVALLRLTEGRGVDGVVDHLGVMSLDDAWRVLRPNGCFLRCDPLRAPLPPASASATRRFAELDATLVEFDGFAAAGRQIDDMSRRIGVVMRALRDGIIKLRTVEIPFDDVETLPAALRNRTLVGAVVVTR